MSDVKIRVNGTPLEMVAHYAEVKVTHRKNGGCWALDWIMDVPPGFRHPALQRGAIVEAHVSASRIWKGRLVIDGAGEYRADGLCRDLETAAAINLTEASIDPGEALFYAGGRKAWGGGTIVTFSPVATAADGLHTVAELLDLWIEESDDDYWWVDRHGTLWTSNDPTAPKFWLTPGMGEVGLIDEEFATSWRALYFDSAAGATKMVAATDSTWTGPRVERLADFTGRGAISATKAQTMVNSLLKRTGPRTGMTNPITVTADHLTNTGGGKVGLANVKAGDMLRLQGLRDPRGQGFSTDVVIGESVWDVGAGEITLSPAGMAARDFSKIVEAAGGKLSL